MPSQPSSSLLPAEETAPLTIHLLGPFRVSCGGDFIRDDAWRLRKMKTLIKLLALAPSHQLHREQLLDLLWPELKPEDAAHNLHQTLYVARRTLEPKGKRDHYLQLQDEVVVLSPHAPLWVDVDAFEAAAEQARRQKTIEAYRAALDLYEGDLLPEDRYDDQINRRREALCDSHHALLLALAALYETHKQYEQARAALEQLIASDPAHEEAQRALMRVLALGGHRQQALRQYQALREALQREVEAEPDRDSQRLYDEILRNQLTPSEPAAPFLPPIARAPTLLFPQPSEPPASKRHSPQNNLPAPLATFVGREHERAEVKRLLDSTRLLTLVGSGGCGKTRLALQVASELQQAQQFADGVWLVELADLSEPSLVVQAAASALNIVETSGASILDTMREQLRTHSLLLVLDNCEHLIQACAQLCETLLRACPQLRILATSREPLHILGELTWRVPSLSLPELSAELRALSKQTHHPSTTLSTGSALSTQDFMRSDAVRLFVERARAVEPTFALTPRNAPIIARICARLDGIPLAIELAASRVNTLAVEQIAARLDNVFRLLGGGSRTALPRQQTLRALMDWSHDLLAERERMLWRRLAVFAGTFTLEAIEIICADAVLNAGDILNVLSELVNKSLVNTQPTDSALRYHLLHTVRQYAFEKLVEAGEDERVRERHRRYYSQLVEQSELALLGPAQTDTLKQLELEYDNLLAALTWSKQASDRQDSDSSKHSSALMQLCGALWSFWYARGSLSEGRQWLADALTRRQSVSHPSRTALVKLLAGAGVLAWLQGDYLRAESLSAESLALSQVMEQPTSMTAAALTVIGVIAQDRGDFVRATIVHEESLRLMRAVGHAFGTALTLDALGTLARLQADYTRARTFLEEALHIQRANGDQWGAALSLHNLAQVAFDDGDDARATALNHAALQLFRALSNTWGIALVLFNLTEIALHERDVTTAETIVTEALVLYEALDDKLGRARLQGLQAQVKWLMDERDEARQLLRESLQARQQLNEKPGTVTTLELLAAIAASDSQGARAARLFGAADALQHAIGLPHPPPARSDPLGMIATARAQVNVPELQSEWEAGRARSLDRAITEALKGSP